MAERGHEYPEQMSRRGRRRRPTGSTAFFRERWRTVAFVLVTLWLCVTFVVVFVRGFPNAERSGTAEEAAAQYQQYLGRGWFPLQLAPLSTAPGWLGLNYSSGTVSTIRPAPSWTSLRVRLAPIGCPHRQPFTVAVLQGDRTLEAITPPAGWSWFTIPLSAKGAPVSLHYSCVRAQQAPVGPERADLAILLSGLTG